LVYDLPEAGDTAGSGWRKSPRGGSRSPDCSRRRRLPSGWPLSPDFSVYCGIPKKDVAEILPALDLVPVAVEHERAGLGVTGGTRSGHERGEVTADAGVAFDSLAWDRPASPDCFEFRHRLEAYTPKEKRGPRLTTPCRFLRPATGSSGGSTRAGRAPCSSPAASIWKDGIPLEPARRRHARALWSAAAWVARARSGVDWVDAGRGEAGAGQRSQAERP